MKKNIAIVTGGDSSELVISLKSAEQVHKYLDPEKYNSYISYIREDDWHVRPGIADEHIPINKNNFSFEMDGRTIRFDYAFIALHGPPGEDGQLQAYLDKLGIPYSTSGADSLKLSFDKHSCKEFLTGKGILSAEAVLICKESGSEPGNKGASAEKTTSFDSRAILDKVGLPCFIKPNAGGSSFGVSRINKTEEFTDAVKKALEEDDEVLVETFIPGSELTCGVLKIPSKEYIFPVTEVISKNEFFDYEAKYTADMAEEVTPAEIPDELAKKCQEISSKIYDLLDCRGLVRIDFINKDGELYFLELNGVPGMSAESIIPKQIRTMGHTEAEIYNLIIRETSGW
ncbi:D-alanine--D-alanine ligase [Bacteroidota bacterium]